MRRLKRVVILAVIGFLGKQLRRKFLEKQDGGFDAHPTAAPFEAHVRGDSVHYEATNPTERNPKDPDEPFGGQPMR